MPAGSTNRITSATRYFVRAGGLGTGAHGVDGFGRESVTLPVRGSVRRRCDRADAGWPRTWRSKGLVFVELILSARIRSPVIAEPPLELGGIQATLAVIAPPETPALAVPMAGAGGPTATTTFTEVVGPVPWALIADTDKVYVAPGVSPVNVRDLSVAVAVPDQGVPPAVPPSLARR